MLERRRFTTDVSEPIEDDKDEAIAPMSAS
jgi:hypothetical protein